MSLEQHEQADHHEQAGRPEFIIAFSAAALSGFVMGLFFGWLVWG